MFRDEEWPEPEDYTAEEIQTDADNQDLSLPSDQEDSEEHEESLPLSTSLVYTSENVDAAELSEDDCDDCDYESSKEGGLTTTDCHINSPSVLPATNPHDSNILVDAVQQQAVNDPALKEKEKNQQEDYILQTKLATSVAKVLGITALVKALDKAKKALHEKQNRNNKYCHDKYKNTVACPDPSACWSQKFDTEDREMGKGISSKAWISTNI